MQKKLVSGLLTGLVFVFVVLALIPASRTWMSRGLMKIGLFKADLSAEEGHRPVVSAGSISTPPVYVSDGSGNRIDAANQRGKVVFINFWATWCPPCVAEMPTIDRLYQQYRDDNRVLFLMVDVDGQYEKSIQFMKSRNLSLPVHVPNGNIPTEWLGNSIPTTIILDKQGRVAARREGMADYGRPEVAEFLDKLLSE